MKSKLPTSFPSAAARLKFGWCQNYLAKDNSNRPVEYDSPSASKWCARGALYAQYGANTVNLVHNYLFNTHQIHMVEWNDSPHTFQEQIVAVVRAAERELELGKFKKVAK